jgi:hypothetical protein
MTGGNPKDVFRTYDPDKVKVPAPKKKAKKKAKEPLKVETSKLIFDVAIYEIRPGGEIVITESSYEGFHSRSWPSKNDAEESAATIAAALGPEMTKVARTHTAKITGPVKKG